MPKSGAERMREHRAKLKESKDEYDESCVKAQARCKLYRENVKKGTNERVQNTKMLTKMRTRKYRERLESAKQMIENAREDDPGPEIIQQAGTAHQTPYASRQALGKAVLRVHKALSDSPRKKRAVVSYLAKEVGIKLQVIYRDNHKES